MGLDDEGERASERAPPSGARLGRYAVLGELGRGGMGRVVRAYDPKLQREVALKELRHDRLGPTTRARLVAEARAMAKLSHPNVVSVFDVDFLGPDGDQLVLVMECVSGETLSQWLSVPRAWSEVVQAFIKAGRGLAAAHDAGLLHRDFKPSNVLVGEDGSVKVTDFGLAKDVDGATESTRASASTATGELTKTGAVAGTPNYMAPEQHRGDPLTANADQFSFCVSLWGALTSELPYEAEELEAQKNEGPPAWTGDGVPARVVEILRRGLAPKPDDRWPDMPSLVHALQREVTPRTSMRFAVVGAALVVAGLGGWSLRDSGGDARCSGARAALERVWTAERGDDVEAALGRSSAAFVDRVASDTRAALDAYAELWVAMHEDACLATAVREEQSVAVQDLRMVCLQGALHGLEAAVAELVTSDETVVSRAHAVVQSLPSIARCGDVEQLWTGSANPAPEDAAAVERARIDLARARAADAAGRYGAAGVLVARAEQAAEGVNYPPLRAEILLAEANDQVHAGDHAAAIGTLEVGLELATASQRWDLVFDVMARLTSLLAREDSAAARRYLGLIRGLAKQGQHQVEVQRLTALILDEEGKAVAAAEAYQRAVEHQRAVGGDPLAVARLEGARAHVLSNAGRTKEATEINRSVVATVSAALGSDHPEVAAALSRLAGSMANGDEPVEGVAIHREAVDLLVRAYGPAHIEVAKARLDLGVRLAAAGQLDDAEAELRATLALFQEHHPDDQGAILSLRESLALVLINRGQPQQARDQHAEVLKLRRVHFGERDVSVGYSLMNLAQANAMLGEQELAVEGYTEAVEIWQEVFEPGDVRLVEGEYALARALDGLGRFEASVDHHRRVLLAREEVMEPNPHRIALSQRSLAEALLELGMFHEADGIARKAWGYLEEDTKASAGLRADAAFVAARSQWNVAVDRAGRSAARALAQRALEIGAETDMRESIETWLRTHR